MIPTKKHVEKQKVVEFESTEHYGEVGVYKNFFGKTKFYILLNSRIIHNSKSWTSTEKQLKRIFVKYNLELT